jgi:hypothetical protein
MGGLSSKEDDSEPSDGSVTQLLCGARQDNLIPAHGGE